MEDGVFNQLRLVSCLFTEKFALSNKVYPPHAKRQSCESNYPSPHFSVQLKMCYFCLNLGDGGNDVSMIQAADAGVGIEGKVRYYMNI